MPQQYGLGRGLSSLIPSKAISSKIQPRPLRAPSRLNAQDEDTSYTVSDTETLSKQVKSTDGVLEVEIGKVRANSHQPRVSFDEEKLQELAESIKKHGIIQPLVVTKTQKEGEYELIAGERRLRASRLAGLAKVPVILRDTKEQEKFEIAILENIQRHDLSPMEEARAYKRLMEEFNLSQEEVALRMGKKRSSIANCVRFLDLPLEIQKGLEEGKIAPGHAKVVLSLNNSEKQRALYEIIIRENLTVRQTESRLRLLTSSPKVFHARPLDRDPYLRKSEEELNEILGTKVRVKKMGSYGTKIIIELYSQEELTSFLAKMKLAK
ncbi:MAG: ParB/RepB/Spo0J family partition protein [Candidatus Moranbacteria bacterium]|nr:ParB/RepB/Spo0J family partition protein [Candidatus Moranbacteria bacterium]